MHITLFKPLSICAALLCGLPALAQDVVGKSAVDGRIIELLSDQTWRYADATDATAPGCQPLPLGLSFCGRADGWTQVDAPSAEIAAQYHFNDRHYGQYVIEGIGSDDGISNAFFRKVVITNAAAAAGISDEEVTVLGIQDDTLDGNAGETIIYQVAIDGLEVVFVNTVVVLNNKSLQAMTFAVGTTLTEEHKKLHQTFLTLSKLQ